MYLFEIMPNGHPGIYSTFVFADTKEEAIEIAKQSDGYLRQQKSFDVEMYLIEKGLVTEVIE